MNEFIGLMDMILYDESIPKYVKQDVITRSQDWCIVETHTQYNDYLNNKYNYLLRVKKSIA